MSKDKGLISLKTKIVTIVFVIAIIVSLTTVFLVQSNKITEFKSLLESQNIKVIEGRVVSPSVIIPTTNLTEFLELAKTNGTVYQDYSLFYVLNNKETIAWQYDPVQEGIKL